MTRGSEDLSLARVSGEFRAKAERGLALFDFDGTLIPWDTQVLFANFVLRREPRRRMYLPVFGAALPFAGILGDEGLKRVFLSYLWRVEREQLTGWVREFVAEWVPGRCYGEVLEKLEEHKAAGHLTVLASASPEIYIKEAGRVLGFDLVLGTPVECGTRMPFFPDLRNHKGAEKVRRLSEIIGSPIGGKWPLSHGYTDSTADLPMMECCAAGTLVNPSARLTVIGEERGWEILRPSPPWTGKADKARKIFAFVAGF